MNKLEQVELAMAGLTSAEKAQILQTVAAAVGGQSPGIESRPDVCGGEACLVRTRIPVWLLELARRLGSTEAELLSAYPTLRAADLVNAWNYIREHQAEIASDIQANEEAS